MNQPLRLGVVTDLHHGPDLGSKMGSRAIPLLRAALGHFERAEVDLIVDLGDRINNAGSPQGGDVQEAELRLTREIAAAFAPCARPRVHLTGNHDIVHLTRDQAAAGLGGMTGSRRLSLKGVDLIFWDADVTPSAGGFRLSGPDLEWLEATLAGGTDPAIVFTHIPFDDGSMVGNPYFESRYAGYGTYRNGDAARAIVRRSDRVRLCLAGHTHWFAFNRINKVPHVTIPSLTDSCDTPGEPEAAWAVVSVADRLVIDIAGRRPVRLELG